MKKERQNLSVWLSINSIFSVRLQLMAVLQYVDSHWFFLIIYLSISKTFLL